METQINTKNKKGFTLVEVLVAMAIFVSVLVIAALAFMHAIQIQRENLAHQELLDQISYTMEYMSRAIRMAKINSPSQPNCSVSADQSYEITGGGSSIEFLQYLYDPNTDNLILCCTKFYESGGELIADIVKVVDGTDYIDDLPLTSPDMEVIEFHVEEVFGSNPKKVEIDLKIRGREEVNIELQTTISQRDFEKTP